MTRAGRIHAILKQLHDHPNKPLIMAWGSIFNTDDLFTVYYMLEKLDREVTLFEEDCVDKNIPQDFYKQIVDQSRNIIRLYNFETHANIVRNKLPVTTLERLYGMSVLGVEEQDVELDIEDDIQQMEDAIKSIDNKEVKFILNEIINLLKNSSTILEINGAGGLNEMIELIYCKTSSNIDMVKKAPKEYLRSFVSAYTKVKKAVNESTYVATLPEKVTTLIENLSNFI